MNTARFARCLPALCLALALSAPAARAATLTVTSAADDGTAGTLRATLAAASAGDTITFALPPRTAITLTQGQLTISKVLHIVGPTGGGITVDGNNASQIFVITAGSASQPVALSNLTLQHGSAAQTDGGAISSTGGVSLTNCTLKNNSALDGGGGLYVQGGSASLTLCVISHNATTRNFSTRPGHSYGGGIYLVSGDLALFNCAVTHNQVLSGSGGGLYHTEGTVSLTRCTFGENSSGGGGGIFSNGGNLIAVNCVFNHNQTGNQGFGGGIRMVSATLTIINSTFTGNAGGLGGAAYLDAGSATFINDILYGDSSRQSGKGFEIYLLHPRQSRVIAKYCDVQEGYGGKYNINADPQFVSASVPRDLRLTASSPCIDAGTANGAPPNDRDGNPRDAHPDIGAFEFQP